MESAEIAIARLAAGTAPKVSDADGVHADAPTHTHSNTDSLPTGSGSTLASAAMMPLPALKVGFGNPLRLLMLHGWTQNAEVFAGKTHAWPRKLKGLVDVVYAEGPHLVPSTLVGGRDNARAWFYLSDDAALSHPHDVFNRKLSGWDTSLAYLRDLWRTEGPFDAVCGFSQGAVAAHQLVYEFQQLHPDGASIKDAEHVKKDTTSEGAPHPLHGLQPPKCALFVCGFPSRHVPRDISIQLPSMHIIAHNDATVPAHHQNELSEGFRVPVVLKTDKGHAMPQRGGDMATILSFLSKHLT